MTDIDTRVDSILTNLKTDFYQTCIDPHWGIGATFEVNVLDLLPFVNEEWVREVDKLWASNDDDDNPPPQLRIRYQDNKFYILLERLTALYAVEQPFIQEEEYSEAKVRELIQWLLATKREIYDQYGTNIL